jgi:DNA polymerase elongation subunit (family B)
MSAFYTNVNLVGDSVLFRGIKDGKRFRKKVHYNPKLYVRSQTPTKWQTLNKEFVEEKVFKGIREARNFINEFKDINNFEIFGTNRFEYAFISDIFPEDIEWDIQQVCVAYIDIEVGSENGFPEPNKANEEITAITLNINGTNYVFGCGDFKNENSDTQYFKCVDEFELIDKFIDRWTLFYPDIVSGWNVRFFDFPYLINRIKKMFGDEKANKLSPWGKLSSQEVNFRGKVQICYDIMGISILDYYELYRKYSSNPNQESYKLDHICNVELGERKLDYSEYENLHQLYKLDYQKFIEYNIKDVELVQRLEDKLRLIELAMTLAYDAKVNYDDVFSQVRMWDTITYNTLKAKHIVIPPKKHSEKHSQYAGAFVKDPILGMHEWVASFDLNSLYPHLIMMYNLSPETLIEPDQYTPEMRKYIAENGSKIDVDSLLGKSVKTDDLNKMGVTLTPNGQLFSIQKQGFLSEIMEKMYEDRAMYKNKAVEAKKLLEKSVSESEKKELEKQIAKYNNIQLAKKVTLNSAYGAIGNQYFRFFDIRIAEAITLSGQLSIRWIENKLNRYVNELLKTKNVDYVIASDTDSIYLNLGPVINKYVSEKNNVPKIKVIRAMDEFCEKKLQPFIDRSYQELSEYTNAYAQKMKMKREALADKAIWTAKKRYLINVYNNEGVEYKTPKLKIMGLEAVKSSTPNICRNKIKEAFEVILTKSQDDLMRFVSEFRKEFKTLPVEEIAFPRSVNGIKEYSDKNSIYSKGTPVHVKGALIYNFALKSKNLEKKYQEIKEGEKIKFIYVKEPNPLQCTVISFLTTIPKEFDLHQYLDYDTQFEKTFLDPLNIVLNSIDWRSEKTNTLDNFFG